MRLVTDIGLTYDDLLLLPNKSSLPSRTSPEIDTYLAGYKVKPIIAANMKSIANLESFTALGKIGITVPFHRFQSYEDRLQEAITAIEVRNRENLKVPVFVSIGLGEIDFVKQSAKYPINGYVLELAHAGHTRAEEEIRTISDLAVSGRANLIDKTLIVGNYGVPEHIPEPRTCRGLKVVWKAGIGGGSMCETRQVTGCGTPMASMVNEFATKQVRGLFIADGAIKTSGDIVKALALGADFVMIGGLFACKEETEDYFAGMASEKDGKIRPGIAPEGDWYRKEKSGSVIDVGNKLIWGIRQGLAMQGAGNVAALRNNATFVRITSNGIAENHTRKF